MPRPKKGTALQRPDLGVIAYRYMMELDNFIGIKIMPFLNVNQQSAEYTVIPPETFLTVPDTSRASRGNYSRGDWKFETAHYATKERGWEEPVDDREAILFGSYFIAEEMATQRAIQIMMRDQERRVAGLLMKPANAVGTLDASVPWTSEDCKPYKDISDAVEQMTDLSGITPTHLIMSKKVFTRLTRSKEVQSYLQAPNVKPLLLDGFASQRATIASYFGVNEVLVGDVMMNSSKKGKDLVLTNIWSNDYVALARLSKGGNDLREPCFGRTFVWTEQSGMGADRLVIETYREESIRGDVTRVRDDLEETITFKGASFLLTGVMA